MVTQTHGSAGGRPERLPGAVIDDLLDSPRRRELLASLVEQERPVAVADLAATLVESETESSDGTSAVERRRARAAIYQEHLPKLTATEVVSFDSRLGTVEFTGPQALARRVSTAADHRGGKPGTKDK